MTRLQILELPTEHHGDDMTTPYLLVIDQVDDATADDLTRWPDDIAKRTGARHVLCFSETIEIPANDTTAYLRDSDVKPESDPKLDAQRLAEERTDVARNIDRLADALGINRGSSWNDIRNTAAETRAELARSENAREHLRQDRDEARSWARHGYEIGLRHCGWTDHGVAPAWLTEGWPPHIDSCEHLKHAADLEETEGIRRRVTREQKTALADALGMDRLRDWDDIHNTARGLRKERDAQADALERVRQLHKPVVHRGEEICWECSAYDFLRQTTDNAPIAYSQCGTLRALNEQPVQT